MKHNIYIVGMGPGAEEQMTGQAIAALEESDVIVGYPVYLKLLGERLDPFPPPRFFRMKSQVHQAVS